VNSDLRFTRINGEMSKLHDRQGDEFTGITIAEAIPSRAAEIEPLVLRAFAGEAIRGIQFSARRPGDFRRFKASFIPIVSESTLPEVLIMLFEESADQDVKRTLELTHERLDLTLEGTRAGIFEWDSSSNELSWSLGMGPLFGQDRGWTPDGYEAYMDIIHPDDREDLQSGVTAAREHKTNYEREFRCIWPDGRERWLHSRVQVLKDSEKTVLLGLVSDIHHRKVRELGEQFLAKTSLALGQSLDVPETARTLAEEIVPAFADWCEIVVFDQDQNVTSAMSLHGDPAMTETAQRARERYWADPKAQLRVRELSDASEAVGRSDLTDADYRSIAVDDEHLALMRKLKPVSILAVPMRARGRSVGTLGLFVNTPGRRFGTLRTSIASELGIRAGIALDNAALMEAEQRANHRLRHLQAVTDAALDNLDLDDLLHELLRRVREMTVVDFAIVLLEDGERGDLTLTASEGLGEDERELRIAPGEGIAGLVLESREALFVEDVQASKYKSKVGEHLRKQVRSVLAVPLLIDDRAIGVLEIGTLGSQRSFSEEELDLLTLVSQRAAQAIVNASIFRHAHETSSMLQGSLLPDSLPAVDGYELGALYRPGQDLTDVGGDWYDVFPLPDGRFAIALGDVVGRGLSAAVLMGQLRAATRAYAREHSDPATVIEKVDDLVEELVAVPFATMVLLALDPATGEVEAASAGHPPPVSSSGGLLDLTAGPALGVPVDSRDSCSFRLDRGEVLVLYTDGLVEQRETPLQDRLDKLAVEIAAGPSVPDELLQHLESAMLGGQVDDDTTAIVLRRLH
jgi:PAS domain S-box-containing protein